MRDALLTVGAVVLVFALGHCSGSADEAAAIARADAEQTIAKRADARSDSLAAVLELARSVADSALARVQADSARWEAERSELQRVASRARAEAASIADELRAIGDSTVTALTDEWEAAHAAERAAWASERSTLVDERDGLRAALWSTRDALAAAESQIQADALAKRAQRETIDALREALDPPLWRRAKADTPKYALGAIIGAIAWEFAR